MVHIMIDVRNKKSAYGSHLNADFKSQNNVHFIRSAKKMKPGYYSEQQYYPQANPIFISIDWDCLNYIRNHHGVCLLCNKNAEFYDFSFCKDKEIWILYLEKGNAAIALKLGYTILRYCPKEVRIIPFNSELLEEDEL